MTASDSTLIDLDPFSPLGRAVMENMRDGIVVFDSGGRMLFANERARTIAGKLVRDGVLTAKEALPPLTDLGGSTKPLSVDGARVGEVVLFIAIDDEASTLAQRERGVILRTLDANGWKLAESAAELGISRTTLWRRLRGWGLHPRNKSRVSHVQ